jgi:RNA-splicing ligase RtcB
MTMENTPKTITKKLLSWAVDIDDSVIDQAHRTARLPIVHDHMALMPDAHIGIGATIGSVVPTESAIIPAAVGVDIGCGMAAIRTDLRADDLPDETSARGWPRSSGPSRPASATPQAKKRFTTEDLRQQMGDRTWLDDRADRLVDEIPSAIDEVMAAQRDLVEVVHTLRQVLNNKGC